MKPFKDYCNEGIDNMINHMVTAMITQEFSDHGTWGCNITKLPYLIASLPVSKKNEFITAFMVKMQEELTQFLFDKDMALDVQTYNKVMKQFNKFNPTFEGGFQISQ
jgi:hypothetical protein